MHDPLADGEPISKRELELLTLTRMRWLMTSLLIVVFFFHCFDRFVMRIDSLPFFEDRNCPPDYLVIIQSIRKGSFLAMLPIVWLCLRSTFETRYVRVLLELATCSVGGMVLLSEDVVSGSLFFASFAYASQKLYISYLLIGFFLWFFIQVTRLKLSFNGPRSRWKFAMADWLSFVFVLSLMVLGGCYLFPGLWWNPRWIFAQMIGKNWITYAAGAGLVTLALGCFFSHSKRVYRCLFVVALVALPLFGKLWLQIARVEVDTHILWVAWTVSGFAFVFTVMLCFPFLTASPQT